MKKDFKHIAFLDFLRGFAIFYVFTYHLHELTYGKVFAQWDEWIIKLPERVTTWLLLPISFGWTGVALFFVISGFCIHLSFESNANQSNTTFLIRRFLRLYPVYLLALVFFAGGVSFSKITGQFESHLFLIHNFGNGTFYGINASFWSIAVEFQLYLLYPVLRYMVRKTCWTKTLIYLGIIEFGLRLGSSLNFALSGSEFERVITGAPFYFWFSWAIGAFIADLYVKGKQLPLQRVPLWLFPLLTVVSDFYKPIMELSFPFASISYAVLIVWFLGKQSALKEKSVGFFYRHLSFVGIFSYSVYLIHQPILVKYSDAIRDTYLWILRYPFSWYLFSHVLWLVVLALSYILYLCIERPSMKCSKRLKEKLSSLAND